jgi:hypothetical protein
VGDGEHRGSATVTRTHDATHASGPLWFRAGVTHDCTVDVAVKRGMEKARSDMRRPLSIKCQCQEVASRHGPDTSRKRSNVKNALQRKHIASGEQFLHTRYMTYPVPAQKHEYSS